MSDKFFKPGGSIIGVDLSQIREDLQKRFSDAFSFIRQFFQVNHPDSQAFFSDNLFTFHKNLAFLKEETFVEAASNNFDDSQHSSQIWRSHVLCWAAATAMKLDGDFVECGFTSAKSAKCIADFCNLSHSNKNYYLYDAKEVETSAERYDNLQSLFNGFANVQIIDDHSAQIINKISPEKIAFMHLNLATADAERVVLEDFYDKLVTGGIIVLNKYGWGFYKDHQRMAKTFFDLHKIVILELPTGQGLVIKS